MYAAYLACNHVAQSLAPSVSMYCSNNRRTRPWPALSGILTSPLWYSPANRVVNTPSVARTSRAANGTPYGVNQVSQLTPGRVAEEIAAYSVFDTKVV